MAELRRGVTTAFRGLEEALASVPANREVEAMVAAVQIVDTATRKVRSFTVGAGTGVDDTVSELSRKDGFVSSTVRLKSCLEPGGGGRSRAGISLDDMRSKLEEEPFVHVKGGIPRKNRVEMGPKLTREAREAAREARESSQAGGGGGGGVGGGNSDGVAAPRVRASGTCKRCKDQGYTGVGHTSASPTCPFRVAVAKPRKRKAIVDGFREVDCNPFDSTGA